MVRMYWFDCYNVSTFIEHTWLKIGDFDEEWQDEIT